MYEKFVKQNDIALTADEVWIYSIFHNITNYCRTGYFKNWEKNKQDEFQSMI